MSTADDIKQSPPLPPEIKSAALAGKLVLFVGAGASMLVGMPSWGGLAFKALEDLRLQNFINFAELEQLSNLGDPRKQLSIAKIIASENAHDLNLGQYLVKTKSSGIYDSINKIGALCITTNYDHELSPALIASSGAHAAPTATRISGSSNLDALDLKRPGLVIHLHGDMTKPDSMIVTTRDYLEHYDDPKVQHFLHKLFEDYVVLFVGYGLEEAEVLEHILRRSNAREIKNERRRFALQPFFLADQPLYLKLKDYYRKSFGVHLIGYARDYEDYAQLESVLSDWSSKIDVRPPTLLSNIEDIDRYIDDE